MAHLLFNRQGNIAFYACTIVYLYGDLAIYAVGMFTNSIPHHYLHWTVFSKRLPMMTNSGAQVAARDPVPASGA